jgi:hypothetical protein
MNKTGYFVVGLGAVATVHYAAWPCLNGNVDGGPDGPPLASVSATVGATGPSLVVGNTLLVYDGYTDAEYDVTLPSDAHRPAATEPVPPTVAVTSLRAGYPGGLFTPPKKPV